MNWGAIISAAAPLIGGMLAGRQSRKAAEGAAGGMRMQEMLPQILTLLQQQMAQSGQRYGQQQQEFAANAPLRDSIRSMAMNMLPAHVTRSAAPSGVSMPGLNMAPPSMLGNQTAPSINSLMDDFARRGGGTGGVGKGALQGAGMGSMFGPVGAGAGAAVGSIVGAVQKKAKTAPTDFAVADAQQALARAIQAYQGRSADPAEIDQMIRGQGWQPGDRWVGEGGLRHLLTQIQQQAARG